MDQHLLSDYPRHSLSKPKGRSRPKARLTCLIPVLWALATSGCATPRGAGDVAVDLDVVPLTASDLGVPASAISTPGERFMSQDRSTGRFPTGVAVVRVVAAEDEVAGKRSLRVGEMPLEQAAYWNQLMDTLPPVREVTILRDLGIDPRGAQWQDFLRESANIDCSLCLMFGRYDGEEECGDMAAVLWDARASKPLAAFRVPIVLDPDLREEYEEEEEPEKLIRAAQVRAESNLRRMVRDALWDLVGQDQPDTTTQPSPWRNEEPLYPRGDDPLKAIERLIKEKRR